MDEMRPRNDQVRRSSSDDVNTRVDREIEENVARTKAAGPEAVDRRLHELDAEWDIERWLEMNAATIALTGSLLALRNRRFIAVPIVVTTFLLQHAIQGWCPPLPLFRMMGARTRKEIDREKSLLLAQS